MGDREKFAFEIGLITPTVAGPPMYKYTILMLRPTRVLFHGYGSEIREVRDTAEAHIALLEARENASKDLARSRQVEGDMKLGQSSSKPTEKERIVAVDDVERIRVIGAPRQLRGQRPYGYSPRERSSSSCSRT